MNEIKDFGMGPVTIPAGKEYTKDPMPKSELVGTKNILVVGTNSLGAHGGGAARFAHDHLGLPWGQAEGIGGNAAGLVTLKFAVPEDEKKAKELGSPLMTDEELLESFKRFKQLALDNPDKKFYLTKVGLGIAGYTLPTIHKAFWASGIPSECENVVFPVEFEMPGDANK